MRSLVLCLVSSLVAFASLAHAQDDTQYAPALDAHRPGRWSMQFQVGPEFAISSFDGAGIAATKNTSGSSAWRLGLTVEANSLNGEGSVVRTDTSIEDTSQPSSSTLNLGLDLLRLKRFHPGRRVGFEVGVGPEIAYAHHNDHQDDQFQNQGNTLDVMNASGFLGLAGRLGAEVMLARSLSAHAHYGLRAGYRRSRATREETFNQTGAETFRVKSEGTQNQWLFDQQGVVLGLSVYL